MSHWTHLIIAGSLSMTLAPLLHGQVQGLGNLSDTRHFIPLGCSDDGTTVAGVLPFVGPSARAGVWTEARGLQELPSPFPQELRVSSVSIDGMYVAGDVVRPDLTTFYVVRWNTLTGARLDIDPPAGSYEVQSSHMSGDGTTVFGTSRSLSGFGLFRWDEINGVQAIQVPSPQSGGRFFDVDLDGSVAVGSYRFNPALQSAMIWEPSTGLVEITGLSGFGSAATQVSRDGLVVVGWSEGLGTEPRKLFRYVAGSGAVELDLNGASVLGDDLLLSADGSTVAGRADFPGSGVKGFVWSASHGLIVLDPANEFIPEAISHDGSVVTGTVQDLPSLLPHASQWRRSSGTIERLPGETPSFPYSAARSANSDGSVVFGTVLSPGFTQEAVIWRRSGEIGQGYCLAAAANSTGRGAELTLSGSNFVDQSRLVIQAEGLPPGSYGAFLVSTAPTATTPLPNSQGLICLDAPFGVFSAPGEVKQADLFGRMDLTTASSHLPGRTGTFTPIYGQSLYFQAWYRDANPHPTTNFTSAATVRFY